MGPYNGHIGLCVDLDYLSTVHALRLGDLLHLPHAPSTWSNGPFCQLNADAKDQEDHDCLEHVHLDQIGFASDAFPASQHVRSG